MKTVTRAFDIQQTEEVEKSVLAEQKRISRQLIPFVTSPVPERTFSGVFLTGDRPCWILSTDKGGVKVMPSGHQVVHAFTACSLWESKGDFLLYSDEVCCSLPESSLRPDLIMMMQGPSLIEWVPEVQFEGHLPSRSVPRSRPYSHVVFEPTTTLLVAASSLQSAFTSYDEDRNVVWEPDGKLHSRSCGQCPDGKQTRTERVPSYLRDLDARTHIARYMDDYGWVGAQLVRTSPCTHNRPFQVRICPK